MAQGIEFSIISTEFESTAFKFTITSGITGGLVLPGGGTDYMSIADRTSSATEANKTTDFNLPTYPGTVSNVWLYISANSTGATSNFRLRKNSINQFSITIAAATTGEFSDTASLIPYIASDTINYLMQEGAAGSLTLRNFSMLVSVDWPSVLIKGNTLIKGGKIL